MAVKNKIGFKAISTLNQRRKKEKIEKSDEKTFNQNMRRNYCKDYRFKCCVIALNFYFIIIISQRSH